MIVLTNMVSFQMKPGVLTFLFLVTVEGCSSSDDCSYGGMCNFYGGSDGLCEFCPGQGSTNRMVYCRSVRNFMIFLGQYGTNFLFSLVLLYLGIFEIFNLVHVNKFHDLFWFVDPWSRKYL